MYAMGFSEIPRTGRGVTVSSIINHGILSSAFNENNVQKAISPKIWHCVQKIIVIGKNKLCLLNCLSEKQSSVRNYRRA